VGRREYLQSIFLLSCWIYKHIIFVHWLHNHRIFAYLPYNHEILVYCYITTAIVYILTKQLLIGNLSSLHLLSQKASEPIHDSRKSNLGAYMSSKALYLESSELYPTPANNFVPRIVCLVQMKERQIDMVNGWVWL
jgi:hypothetical protein